MNGRGRILLRKSGGDGGYMFYHWLRDEKGHDQQPIGKPATNNSIKESSQKRKRRASQILATDNTQDLATEDESTSLGRSLRRRHDPTPEAVNEPIFSTRSTSSRTPRNTSYANQGPSTGRYVATAVTESISSFEHTSPQDRLQGAAPRSMNAAKPSSGAQSDLSALFRDMERASEIRPGVQPGSTFTVSFAGQEN